MAKTPEQKAATKEASLLKKAAHSARNRELCEAEEIARSTAESTPLAQEYEAAQKAEEESRGLRKTLVAEVEVQIDTHELVSGRPANSPDPEFEKWMAKHRGLVDQFYEVVDEIHSYGCFLKDVDLGLIDLPIK